MATSDRAMPRPGASYSLEDIAARTLKAAATFWFSVVVVGQLIFVTYIVSFYGRSVAAGDFARWNKVLFHGYIPGDRMGNVALGVHIAMAALITLSGAIQLIPQLRNRFPVLHRANGRVYVSAAFITSIVALYLLWIRGGSVGDISQHLGNTLVAVLILVCAALALRYAVAGDFKTHRRWALRLFLVVSGSWFFRVGLMLSFLIFKGPVGFDPSTFQGPFITFLQYAEFLVPLAVLELYLRTGEQPTVPRRLAMATVLFVLTLAMGAGIAGAAMGMWVPHIKSVRDSRTSIIGTLTPTIEYRGVDAAVEQYHQLKSTAPVLYNFDEDELNALGYHLLHRNKFPEALRIFQLNVEAYPQSGEAYDSLAEGYMDEGEKALAIAMYQKSLQLNPRNGNAVRMLKKLNAP